MRKLAFLLGVLAAVSWYPLTRADAYNCYITNLECVPAPGPSGGIAIQWEDIICDGACNICPFVLIYRESSDSNCPEARHQIGSALLIDDVFTDTNLDLNMCYKYTVEIRRNCPPGTGTAACEYSLVSCGPQCPCIP